MPPNAEEMAKLAHLAFGIGRSPEQVSVAKLSLGQNYNMDIRLNYL